MVLESQIPEIDNLEIFKAISSNQKNHEQLLKEKQIIFYAANLLNNENLDIIDLCLDIFENLIANKDSHVSLMSIFGGFEFLDSLCSRMRNRDDLIFQRVSHITDILRKSRKTERGGKSFTTYTPHQLYKSNLIRENSLIKIKRVGSHLIHIQVKKYILGICSNKILEDAVKKMFGKRSFKCLIENYNEEGNEDLLWDHYDVLLNTPNRSYLEYPEEDFLQQSGAVATATADTRLKPGFLNYVLNIWNAFFYFVDLNYLVYFFELCWFVLLFVVVFVLFCSAFIFAFFLKFE